MVKQSLKLAVICILTLVILALPGFSSQGKSESAPPPFSPAPYRIGERLTYNVSFDNFISAAHVELLVGARGSFFVSVGVQLRAHAETTGLLNAALFAINNNYVT